MTSAQAATSLLRTGPKQGGTGATRIHPPSGPGAAGAVAQNRRAVVASAPVAVMLAASRGDALTF